MSKRLEQLNAMLQLAPSDAFLLFAVAKEHEKLGDKNTALVYYERLLATEPDYVGLYYHLGKLHESEQRLTEAQNDYEQGTKVARKIADFHALSELNGALDNLIL